MADESADVDRATALQHVKKKSGCAEGLVSGTEDVGCADVATADGAHVLLEKETDQQVSNWTGSQQIRDSDDHETRKQHAETEFNTCGGQTALARQWDGRLGADDIGATCWAWRCHGEAAETSGPSYKSLKL